MTVITPESIKHMSTDDLRRIQHGLRKAHPNYPQHPMDPDQLHTINLIKREIDRRTAQLHAKHLAPRNRHTT